VSVAHNPYASLPANVYKTALHFHSTTSDGEATQAEITTLYEAAGFDVAICADHDAANADPAVAGILWIPGIEETANDQSEPYSHVVSFPASVDDASYAAQTIIDNAAIAVLAHPNMNSPTALPLRGDGSGNAGFTQAEAIALTGYDAIEIYNPFSVCLEATDVWDAVLSTGRQVYGTAGDDCHQPLTYPAWLGRCWNMVYADALTQDDICRAIRSGQFYATRGPLLTITADYGSMTVSSADAGTFTFIGRGGATLQSSTGTSASYSYRASDLYVRCEFVRTSDSLKAWTQPVFLTPSFARKSTKQHPSLLVGSDTLGWVELGGKAVLGEMTKAMPGGDGSLDFALYGDDAWQARNVLIPGESRVILTAGGEAVWGGRIATDPVRHRLSCQSDVEVGAVGIYGLAARDGRYGCCAMDTDPEQWRRYSDQSVHTGRFTYAEDGALEIRAETDRTYAQWDFGAAYYLLHDGMIDSAVHGLSTRYLRGAAFEYKLSLPSSDWYAGLLAGPEYGIWATEAWGVTGAATVSAWTAVDVTVPTPLGSNALTAAFVLQRVSGGTGSPATDAWLRVRKRVVSEVQSLDGGAIPSLGDVLAFITTGIDIDVNRIHADLAAHDVTEFVSRFPTDVAETMRQACALYPSPVEAFFDLDPVTLTCRFTARPRPSDTSLAPENRLWVVGGGRGGEDTSGLVRDWEATPEQVTVLYAVKDHATLPDGTVCSVTYPGGTESTYPKADVVDLTQETTMTDATAANYAQAIYAYGQSNRYSGEVVVGETAYDEHGSDQPTYRLRPGDRITALDRDDTDRFGETLYVQETSYDWRTHTGSVTIGTPFDPLETGWNGSSGTQGSGRYVKPDAGRGYKVRSGIA